MTNSFALPVISAPQHYNKALAPTAVPSGGRLIDNYGRPITYLRLAVTDRCNLRCFYCMPETMKFVPQKEILSYEEMLRLVTVAAEMGIRKIRITGGEPFVRKDIMRFLWAVRAIEGIEEIHITTNGVLTAPLMPELRAIGINSINLSIDSFDRERFHAITRRDDFEAVQRTFYQVLEHDIPLKVNSVVMEGKNTDDILPLAALTKEYPFEMRFIEEMPFNGSDNRAAITWNHTKILEVLRGEYPTMQKIEGDIHSTSVNYAIEGHRGTVGIIAGYSRTFCGACNRIRVTAKGMLKTCLYDNGVLDLKRLLRDGADDTTVRAEILQTIAHRFKDGYEAEEYARTQVSVLDSMSAIGG